MSALCHKQTNAPQRSACAGCNDRFVGTADVRDFAERALRNIDASGWPLVGFDIGRPDHFAPLLGLVGDKLTEVAGRARKDAAAEVGKPRLDLGIGEASVDLLFSFS